MKTAFVGLGSMGGPQAQHVSRAGFELAVFDPAAPALERFRGTARLASSAADAARGAEIACVCVRDDQQLEAAVFGPAGIAEGLAPGGLLLVHSTVRIDFLKQLESRLVPRRISLVDAPVTRTRPTNDDPFVLTMLGGEPEQRKRALPVARSFSTAVEEVGPLGSAMALKISNNLVTWVHIVVGRLASELASHHGVPHEKLVGVMQANGNLTPTVSGLLDGFRRSPLGTDPDRDAFLESQTGIGEKDLLLAIECVEAAGLDVSMLAQARKQIRAAMIPPRR